MSIQEMQQEVNRLRERQLNTLDNDIKWLIQDEIRTLLIEIANRKGD